MNISRIFGLNLINKALSAASVLYLSGAMQTDMFADFIVVVASSVTCKMMFASPVTKGYMQIAIEKKCLASSKSCIPIFFLLSLFSAIILYIQGLTIFEYLFTLPAIILGFTLEITIASLNCFKRHKQASILTTIQIISFTLLLIPLTSFNTQSILPLLIINTASFVFSYYVSLFFRSQLIRQKQLTVIDFNLLKMCFEAPRFQLTIYSSILSVFSGLDVYILGLLSSASEVRKYVLSLKMYSVVLILITTLNTILNSHSLADKLRNNIFESYKKALPAISRCCIFAIVYILIVMIAVNQTPYLYSILHPSITPFVIVTSFAVLSLFLAPFPSFLYGNNMNASLMYQAIFSLTVYMVGIYLSHLYGYVNAYSCAIILGMSLLAGNLTSALFVIKLRSQKR